ncbi:hypothetical protein ACFVGY_06500 [Streptomyces sp. NPDC127106]|uniref:hypothetical protein n=1 Tax=Streptomyces sp. NPDC127106 TaxID=3345360 RepID=UPI003626311A
MAVAVAGATDGGTAAVVAVVDDRPRAHQVVVLVFEDVAVVDVRRRNSVPLPGIDAIMSVGGLNS